MTTKKEKRHIHKIRRDDPGDCADAVCVTCDENFGWYCPRSPDHVCHYESYPVDNPDNDDQRDVDRYVISARQKGVRYYLPWDYTVRECYENETDDHCIYCEQPEERK